MGIAGRRPGGRRPGRAVLSATVGAALVLSACTATSATTAASTTAGTSTSSTSGTSPSTTAAAGAVTGTATPTSTSTVLTADQPVPKAPSNDLAKNSAHRLLPIDGEVFKLKVDYWTTVDSTTWDATGAKNVHLLAYVQPAAGKAPDVVLDRFTAAFTLVAGQTGLTGVAAGNTVDPDSSGGATDSPGADFGGGLPGFLLTSKVSYGAQFGVAGVSTDLVDRWQLLAPRQVLSEAALQRAGVYAVRASMTYRLLVRNAGDTGWHRRTVVDTLTVPVKARS